MYSIRIAARRERVAYKTSEAERLFRPFGFEMEMLIDEAKGHLLVDSKSRSKEAVDQIEQPIKAERIRPFCRIEFTIASFLYRRSDKQEKFQI